MEQTKTIHDLDHVTIAKITRLYAKQIGLLARRGEPLSVKVKAAYEEFYDHQGDPRLMANYRELLKDWMRQHLEVSSRLELASKYGYLVDEVGSNEGPKIVTLQ